MTCNPGTHMEQNVYDNTTALDVG